MCLLHEMTSRNSKIVDYLDVTFNRKDSSCCPFSKTNNEINYIQDQLNHPPSIIKQLPLSVKRHVCNSSSNKKISIDFIPTYQEALVKVGYNYKYQKQDQKKENTRQRKRKIIWFNLPA